MFWRLQAVAKWASGTLLLEGYRWSRATDVAVPFSSLCAVGAATVVDLLETGAQSPILTKIRILLTSLRHEITISDGLWELLCVFEQILSETRVFEGTSLFGIATHAFFYTIPLSSASTSLKKTPIMRVLFPWRDRTRAAERTCFLSASIWKTGIWLTNTCKP